MTNKTTWIRIGTDLFASGEITATQVTITKTNGALVQASSTVCVLGVPFDLLVCVCLLVCSLV
jgi:hypothetical protein